MSVFEQLCQAALGAQDKGLISQQMAERICAIGRNHVNYKHLGLEMHGLIARLVPAAAKGRDNHVAALDDLVQLIEDRYRRL